MAPVSRSRDDQRGGLRVLVAEDNAVNQHLIRRLLEKWRHSVFTVENGEQAVEAATRGTFDLILMDVQMPKMDGLEATARLRSTESAAGGHHRIVAMTANAMTGDRERCLAAGMDGYLSKPIRARALAALLKALQDEIATGARRAGAPVLRPDLSQERRRLPPAASD